MRELLTQALEEGQVCPRRGQPVALMSAGERSAEAFEEAWGAALALMTTERAYPHRTEPRHQWQEALEATKPEFRACWLKLETGYSRWHTALLKMVEDRTRFAGDDAVIGELVA